MIKVLSEHGEDFFPVTVSDAVGHDQCKCSLTDLIDSYNVSAIWPKESAYDLTSAITALGENLLEGQKRTGVTVKFIGKTGTYEEWEYWSSDYEFTDTLGWRQKDTSILVELAGAVFPVTTSLTSSATLLRVGDTKDVEFTWKVIRKGEDVTKEAKKYFEGEPIDTLGTTLSLVQTGHTTITYTFTGTYQNLTSTSTKSIVWVDPTFYGVVEDGWVSNVENVKALSGNTLRTSASFTWTTNLNNQKLVYAYPTYHGVLGSIKDANNFDYIGSYTRSTLTIDSVEYYVYVLTNPTTITNVKQTYGS